MSSNSPFAAVPVPTLRLLFQSCLVLLAGGLINFLIKFYRIRGSFQRMQRDGLPMPPHHPVFGHLQLVAEIMAKCPSDVHGHVLPHQIKKVLPDLGPVFYIDTWPFGPPILAITDPDSTIQITQSHSLPKFHALAKYMRPMTGGNDLVTMEGAEWKKWRNIFNPGFSSSHLMTLVPDIMKDISIFCEILRESVEKAELVSMDTLATRLSLDVIGRAALDTHFNSQRSTNIFVSAVRSQVRWLSFGNEPNLFERFHPLRPIMTWWNDRRMLQYIWRELDKRFQSRVAGSARSKTVIDLALDNYLAGEAKDSSLDTMDLTFRDFATSQLRTFVFAGHDSTSSTICYAFHLLSVHPNARRLLIAELDEVLGSDHTQAAAKISENPHVLNQLLYTTAVIKETLRLYPPASSTRSGEPGYSFPGPNGVQFPTERFYLVWSNAYGVQRDPKHWPEADKFLPERWTAQEGDLLYPPRGVFRPFEFGPRNCIGQELAMLELKIVLATTMQEFNITSVYDEWDRLHPSKGIKTLDGDRAYQILFGAAHPNDGLPCRVSLAAR